MSGERILNKDTLRSVFELGKAPSVLPQLGRRKKKARTVQSETQQYSSPDGKGSGGGDRAAPLTPEGLTGDGEGLTPIFQSPTPITKEDQFPLRQKKGQVAHSFGNVDYKTLPAKDTVSVKRRGTPIASERWMRETVRERFDAEESLLRSRALEILSAHKSSNECLLDVTETSLFNCDCFRRRQVERCIVAGRIVISSDEVKLNNTSSLCLESVEGDVKSIRVEKLSNFSFFPGQVVVAEVENSYPDLTQDETPLDVIQVFSSVVRASTKKDNSETPSERVPILFAAGPFSSAANLDYVPLKAFLDVVRKEKPSVVILSGPFVDLNHSLVATSKESDFNLCWSFEEILQKKLIHPLVEVAQEQKNCKFIVVGSPMDATEQPRFPCPAMKLPGTEEIENIVVLPSPSILDIEGVSIGISPVDTVGDLVENSVTKFEEDNQKPERIAKLLEAALGQGSFYPMHPSSQHALVNITDHEALTLPSDTDIVILPARRLRFFTKEVLGKLCINPERLVKFSSGGTYARINLLPGYAEKAVVEIVRI